MGLAPGLVPITYAEIYRELLDRCAPQLDERLEEIDRDLDWLNMTVRRYQRMWQFRLDQQMTDQDLFEPAGGDHATLASWIVVAARGSGPSLPVSQAIQDRIRPLVGRHGAAFELVAQRTRPSLAAWALGQVVGEYDRTMPVAFFVQPADDSVALAYEGLVRHVLGLPDGDGEWSEMLGSSILWRACGIADGLRPQTPRLNLAASVEGLIHEMRPVVQPMIADEWRREWGAYKDIRDAFTHVAAGERGLFCFADVATRMRDQEDVRIALTSVTHFVGHQVALELVDQDPAMAEVAARNVDFELEMYDDLTEMP